MSVTKQKSQIVDDGSDLLGPETAEQMQPVVMTAQNIRQVQAQYKGNQHSDLVEVTIIKDDVYLRAGQKLLVHPTAALILQSKGLIEGTGKPYTRPPFENKDVTVDV